MPYNPNFIPDCNIALPILSDRLMSHAFDEGNPVDHLRYTFVFNQTRQLSLYTAHNIDGSALLDSIERHDRFRNDPDIPSEIQLKNRQGYLNNDWDRGHLVKRTAMHWGTDVEFAVEADSETFYWTNIVPQHEPS